LALLVALDSGAYAAKQLPRNSVGKGRIKKNAVNGRKVAGRWSPARTVPSILASPG